MALLFMPIVQNNIFHFKFERLHGVVVKTPKPALTLESYSSGEYQANIEKYTAENYGFREPTIRLYNQYLWDFYKKSYSNEVTIGKDNWLYFSFHVNDYYGKEMYRFVTKENAVETFSRQVRLLNKLRYVLKTYGIEFMIFTSPDKADLYPQHLPEREFDTTTIHAMLPTHNVSPMRTFALKKSGPASRLCRPGSTTSISRPSVVVSSFSGNILCFHT